MWSVLNKMLNAAIDAWLWPFQELGMVWQLIALALPAAVFSLLVFRLVSNQAAIRSQKDKIKAYLLELLLYKDDLRVTMAAQRSIFGHSLRYMGHALLPMVVMILPFILLVVQVESRYAFRALERGEQTILAVSVEASGPVSKMGFSLQLPEGLVQETPAMRADTAGEVLWRIRADSAGQHTAIIDYDDGKLEKLIVVDEQTTRLAPSLYRANDFRTLGYPAEPALADDQVVSKVMVNYARARGEFIGLSSASWLFFLFTLVLGFMLRGVLGVTF